MQIYTNINVFIFEDMRNNILNTPNYLKKMLMALAFLPLVAQGQYDVSLTEIATGYNRPCEIVNAGDERLFVLEQTGLIRILYIDGTQESEPFMDISDRVDASGSEMGLLGIAFPPDYCTSGVFYVNYTTTIGGQLKTHISRFSVDPDNENHGMENSENVLLSFDQPFGNHNGGHIEFGPDGYLYIGTGDGGNGGDPFNNAQNLQKYLGKLLRIDVSGPTPELPYNIPADNPFVGQDGALGEIWAFGLRNPWKYAFDSENGDLFIADVGQSIHEEVDYVAAGTAGGMNFGWRCYEGTAPYDLSECDGLNDFTVPIFDFTHSNPSGPGRCSVTGGRVYRGSSFQLLDGKYIFTDYCSGEYWLSWQENGEWQNFHGAHLGDQVVSFGSDIWGELYAVEGSSGKIYRVEEASGTYLGPIIMVDDNTIKSALEGSSYTWFLNGVEISDANDQNLPISESGEYSVEITTLSGCTVTSPEVDIISSGLEDHEFVNSFNVYPNPAQSHLSIDLQLDNTSVKNVEISVFDVSGKRILSINPEANTAVKTIDVSMLSKGMYFVYCYLSSGEMLAVRKVVIN